jgi:hypothetical protein
LGASGFSQFDANNSGYPEILFGSGHDFGPNRSFIILEFNAAKNSFESLCQSIEYDQNIVAIRSFQNESLDAATLLVLEDGSAEIIDHRSGSIAARFNTGLTEISDVEIADADNDGQPDIIVLNDTLLNIYDANRFSLKGSYRYGGSSVTVGRFTQPDKNEIAINTGYLLSIQNGVAHVEWNYSTLGFGDYVVSSGDLDGDHLDEIVAGDRWNKIKIFNADTGGSLWEMDPGLNISALEAIDIDSDGISEVIYSDGQHGSTYILKGGDGSLISTFDNFSSGVTNVLVDDLDLDGSKELLFGSGYETTGADLIQIMDLASDSRQWRSPYHETNVFAVALGDVNGDQIADKVHASSESESGHEIGLVTALDGVTGDILWRTEPDTFGMGQGINAIAVADIDHDQVNEVLVGIYHFNGAVYILDSSTGAIQGSVVLDSESPIHSLKVIDYDGDGSVDILAGNDGFERGTDFYVIHPQDLTWEKPMPSLSSSTSESAIWSFDIIEWENGKGNELIAILGGAFIIDPAINSLNRTIDEDYLSLATQGNRAFIANTNGEIRELRSDTTTVPIATVCEGSVHSLVATTANTLAYTCDGRLGMIDVATGIFNWQTGFIDSNLGIHDSLVYEKVNGKNTLVAGGAKSYHFEN